MGRSGFTDKAILDAVESIYLAASDAGAWQQAIDRLLGFFPDGKATLLSHDVDAAQGLFAVNAGWEEGWTDRYNEHYSGANPWLANLKRRPVGLATPAEFMLPRQQLMKTEFFADFLRPQTIASGIGVTIHQDAGRFVAVSVLYSAGTAERERDNVELLQRLSGHYRRALQVNRQLEGAGQRNGLVEAALDRMQAGVAVTDRAGKVLYLNRAAERLLRQPGGLTLGRAGQLGCARTADSVRLAAAIASAAAWDGASGAAGDAFRVGQTPEEEGLGLLVAPLRPCERAGTPQCAAAIVLMKDRRPPVPAAWLGQAFGLTRSEARLLALLVGGEPLQAAGRALGISLHTARTHLKNLLQKMGCARQADAILCVTAHPLWLGRQD